MSREYTIHGYPRGGQYQLDGALGLGQDRHALGALEVVKLVAFQHKPVLFTSPTTLCVCACACVCVLDRKPSSEMLRM
jgi:hypothetical protein